MAKYGWRIFVSIAILLTGVPFSFSLGELFYRCACSSRDGARMLAFSFVCLTIALAILNLKKNFFKL